MFEKITKRNTVFQYCYMNRHLRKQPGFCVRTDRVILTLTRE